MDKETFIALMKIMRDTAERYEGDWMHPSDVTEELDDAFKKVAGWMLETEKELAE